MIVASIDIRREAAEASVSGLPVLLFGADVGNRPPLSPAASVSRPNHIPIRAVSCTHNTRAILLERPLTVGEMRVNVL